jgi:hypothetical protein
MALSLRRLFRNFDSKGLIRVAAFRLILYSGVRFEGVSADEGTVARRQYLIFSGWYKSRGRNSRSGGLAYFAEEMTAELKSLLPARFRCRKPPGLYAVIFAGVFYLVQGRVKSRRKLIVFYPYGYPIMFFRKKLADRFGRSF